MPIPGAQLATGGNLLEPDIHVRPLFGEPARPESLHQHARAIAPKLGVRTVDEQELRAIEKHLNVEALPLPIHEPRFHGEKESLWGISVPKGAEPTADFYLYEPRSIITTVRVSDIDGLSGTAGQGIVGFDGAEWHVTTIATGEEEITHGPYVTSLLDVGGHPAISYRVGQYHTSPSYLKYFRADDPFGTAWGERV